jgi:hypothetical protein
MELMNTEVMTTRCSWFPDCVCGSLWLHWQIRLTEMWESDPLSPGELDVAEVVLFEMLRCVADSGCTDLAWRQSARRQLTHPAFDRQHRLLKEKRARWYQQ